LAQARQTSALDAGLFPQRNYMLAGGNWSLALVDFDRDGQRDLYCGGRDVPQGPSRWSFYR
jgi:hypothetical protein